MSVELCKSLVALVGCHSESGVSAKLCNGYESIMGNGCASYILSSLGASSRTCRHLPAIAQESCLRSAHEVGKIRAAFESTGTKSK